MTPLHPSMTIGLGDGESPVSFCSRMANLFKRTARDFCRDMGLSFQDVVDGNQEALQSLAFRCRADFDRLTMASIVKVADRRYQFGKQDLVRDILSRATMRVCPHCLMEDMAVGEDVEQLRPYGRTLWLITPIRTCPRHNAALVKIADEDDPNRVHDFALLIDPSPQSLAEIGKKSQARCPSSFEIYLIDRLASKATMTSWLDRLPFYAAAKVCETLGAVATRGIRFRANDLTESDWQEAGAAGFEVASSGEKGIKSLLSQLQENFPSTRTDWGPRMIFGRLYEWLAHESEDIAYEPLRDVIREHVIETMPVGPGNHIFGREVTTRRLHSVRSASLETGAHPKRLRKLLRAAGHISADTTTLTDDRVVFDAEKARGFLERVSETMSLHEAGKYVNAPRLHERLLFDAGFIQPFVFGGTDILNSHAFAKRDLDAFLDRLLPNVGDVGDNDNALMTMPDAAKRANCSAMEIVQLILDKKLAQVRRKAGVAGYMSVLVDPAEVKPLVKGADIDGLRLRDVERRLRTTTAVVNSLISCGHLLSGIVVNPVNRCPQRIVKEDDLTEFMETYASLHALARERGTREKNLRLRFDELDIAPAFTLKELNMEFYDRRTVAERIRVPDIG